MTREQWELRRLYRWSFAARFGAGMAGWLLMKFTGVSFLDDARNYEEIAGSIANDWLHGRSSSWLMAHGHETFQPLFMLIPLASFYVLTLGVRALPVVMAAYSAVTAFAPGWTYRITRQLGASPRAAMSSAWLVALCPAFVFWSGALYKEGLIILTLNIGIFQTLRLQTAWRPRALVILGLCILALSGLRIYLALIIACILCLGLVLARTRGRAANASAAAVARQALVVLLFLAVMVGIGAGTQLSEVFPDSLKEGFDKIEMSRRDLAAAESGYLRDVEINSVEDTFRFMPQGLSCFLAVPLPWQIGSVRQNLAIPDTALWLFLLYPLMLVGVFKTARRNPQGTILLLAATTAICCFYAIFVGNIGTAYRMRVQVWLLWAPLVGIGWQTLQGRSAFTATMPRTKRRKAGAGRSSLALTGLPVDCDAHGMVPEASYQR